MTSVADTALNHHSSSSSSSSSSSLFYLRTVIWYLILYCPLPVSPYISDHTIALLFYTLKGIHWDYRKSKQDHLFQ